jgi:hypothetical protein
MQIQNGVEGRRVSGTTEDDLGAKGYPCTYHRSTVFCRMLACTISHAAHAARSMQDRA